MTQNPADQVDFTRPHPFGTDEDGGPVGYAEYKERELFAAMQAAANSSRVHLPWWLHVLLEHERDTAYDLGRRTGLAEYDAELVDALTRAIGGPNCTDRREAVRWRLASLDARRRRQEFDHQAALERKAA